jgi:hypothetical protein
MTYSQYFENSYNQATTLINKQVVINDDTYFFTGKSHHEFLFKGIKNQNEEFSQILEEDNYGNGFDIIKRNDFVYSVGYMGNGDTIYQGDMIFSKTNIYLVKSDIQGNKIWTKEYNYSSIDEGTSIVNIDTSLIIASTMSDIENVSVRLSFLDTLGNVYKVYDLDKIIDEQLADKYIRMLVTRDSNILVYYTETYPTVKSSILKFDYRNDSILWHVSSSVNIERIIETDNSFIAVGSNNHKAVINKLDLNGNVTYERDYNLIDFYSVFTDVEIVGKYIYTSGWKQSTDVFGKTTSFIAKISVAGDSIWLKEFGNHSDSKLLELDILSNGFLSSGRIGGKYYADLFVVRTDFMESVEPSLLVSNKESSISQKAVQIYPNPTNGSVNIEIGNNDESYSLNIYNLTGQLEYTSNAIGNTTINLGHLKKGLKLVRIQTKDNLFIYKVHLK